MLGKLANKVTKIFSPPAADVQNTKGPTDVAASILNSRQAELERCMLRWAPVNIDVVISGLQVEGVHQLLYILVYF
jgi:hypothetical protein